MLILVDTYVLCKTTKKQLYPFSTSQSSFLAASRNRSTLHRDIIFCLPSISNFPHLFPVVLLWNDLSEASIRSCASWCNYHRGSISAQPTTRELFGLTAWGWSVSQGSVYYGPVRRPALSQLLYCNKEPYRCRAARENTKLRALPVRCTEANPREFEAEMDPARRRGKGNEDMRPRWKRGERKV